jgi:hypothetical protein
LVESREFGSGDYLSNLIDYVHLNPIRAGILNGTTQSLIDYQSAQIGRDHGQAQAEKIVQQSIERFGLSESDLKSLPGSDPRKVAIAGFIHQSTTTPQGWTAERLQMKSAANVSQLLSRAKKGWQTKYQAIKTNYLVRICLLTDPFLPQ